MSKRTTSSAASPAKKQKITLDGDVSGRSNSTSNTSAALPPLDERIASLLPILEAHKVSPADLLLAVVKAERREPAQVLKKKYRDDLYKEQGNSRSKLSDILETVTESKKGLKTLKRWLRCETAEEIITGIIEREIHGDIASEEEEEEEE